MDIDFSKLSGKVYATRHVATVQCIHPNGVYENIRVEVRSELEAHVWARDMPLDNPGCKYRVVSIEESIPHYPGYTPCKN